MRVGYETITEVLGPGKRYVIWVQGCKKRCNGCINPLGWYEEKGYNESVENLFKKIISFNDLTGITISGGEPMLQFDEIKKLTKLIKTHTQLDIMLFSGYTLKEIRKQYGKEADDFFKIIDIFIDGEYKDELNNSSMYRGSDNQNIYFFTEKYRAYKEKILSSTKRDFSFEINGNGDVYFIGIPPIGFYEKFIKNLKGE